MPRPMIRRIPPSLLLAAALLAAPMALASAPEPCKVLPAEAWSSVMGSAATAAPAEMTCTYQSKTGGGQFRIMASSGSASDAAATVKRMRDHQSHQPRGGHDPRLNVVDSQGNVVFSVALFQETVTPETSSQLQKLVASVKQHLPR